MTGVSFYDSFCAFWIQRPWDLRGRILAGLLVLILLLLSQSGCTNKSSTVTGGMIQMEVK
jgi:hypothetical protein